MIYICIVHKTNIKADTVKSLDLTPAPKDPALYSFKFLFIYLFSAALSLCCRSRAFSSCREQGYSSLQCVGFSLQWLLVAEHRF